MPKKRNRPLLEEETPTAIAAQDDQPPLAEETAAPEVNRAGAAGGDCQRDGEPGRPLAEAAPPPLQREEVEISRRKLKKQVAFLGISTRSASVSPGNQILF